MAGKSVLLVRLKVWLPIDCMSFGDVVQVLVKPRRGGSRGTENSDDLEQLSEYSTTTSMRGLLVRTHNHRGSQMLSEQSRGRASVSANLG